VLKEEHISAFNINLDNYCFKTNLHVMSTERVVVIRGTTLGLLSRFQATIDIYKSLPDNRHCQPDTNDCTRAAVIVCILI